MLAPERRGSASVTESDPYAVRVAIGDSSRVAALSRDPNAAQPLGGSLDIYSVLSVWAGSIWAARHAGTPQAASATPATSAVTPR